MRLRDLLPFTLAAGLLAQPKPDLTKPPETPPIPAYKLPPVYEASLANGLRISLVEDKRFPLVTVRLIFHAGSKFDPKEQPGLAGAVASLVTEGTKTRTQRQLAEELTAIGGALNGSATADALTLAGSSLSEHLAKLLTLIADVALNASFPQDEVNLYKQNRKQALIFQKSQPAFLAEETLSKTVWGEASPYAHIAPTVEALDGFDAKIAAAFRDTHLVPNNAHLIVLGDIPARAAMMKLVESSFAKWEEKPAPAPPKIEAPPPARWILLVDRPGSVQADIHTGHLAVSRKSEDHMPLRVGSIILGGGADSRMFNEIREKKGFAYDAHTELDLRPETGVFKAVTQVRNEVIGDAMAALLKEMEAMGADRVTAEELSNAKNYASGVFLLGLETQGGLANQLAMTKEMGLPVSYLETYTAKIRATEPDQIQSAAKKYIVPGDAAIVVVGDASKIQKELEKFGQLKIVKP
jgi:zinc protease